MPFMDPGTLDELKRQNQSITAELREQLSLQEKLTAMERGGSNGGSRGGVSPTPATFTPVASRSREDFSRMFKEEVEKEGRSTGADGGSFGLSARTLARGGRGLAHILGGASSIHSRDIGGIANASAGIAGTLGFGNVANALGGIASAAAMAMPFAQTVLSGINVAKGLYDEQSKGMSEFLKTSQMQTAGNFNVARIHRDRSTAEQIADGNSSIEDRFARMLGFDPTREKVEKELQRRMSLAKSGISFEDQDTKYNPKNFLNSAAVKHASSFQDRGALSYVYDALFSTPEDRKGRDMQAAVEESQRVMAGEMARREVMHEQWLDTTTDGTMNRVVEKQRSEWFKAIEHDRSEKYNDWNRF